MKPKCLEPHPNIIKYYRAPSDSQCLEEIITTHPFNISVALLVPDTMYLDDSIKDEISKDSTYYKVYDVPMYRLVEKTFIDAFIKKGETTILSSETMLDLDDCCGVTAAGVFALSLTKDTFVSLGIEQSPAISVKKLIKDNKYLVIINLKAGCFVPGKPNFDKTLNKFKQASDLKMDLLVSWDPCEGQLCPSSIAKYFDILGFKVEERALHQEQRVDYNTKIPSINSLSREFFEWIGVQCIGIKSYADPAQQEFLSTYYGTDDMVEVGQTFFIQWTGLLPTKRVHNLYKKMRQLILEKPGMPFIGMHVQGCEDSPISWGEQAHHYVLNGDNNFTYIFQNNGTTRLCKNQIAPYN